MKTCIFIAMVLACCAAFGQQSKPSSSPPSYTANDALHWDKDRKLTWDDFKGIPDSTSPGAAGTVSGMYYESLYEDDTSIILKTFSSFNKKKSWVKNNWKDSATLNHEQGHFNITEVYARKLNGAFKKYKYNKATATADIDNIFNRYFKEMNKVHSLYDKETTKPINNRKQKEWDKKIAAWLKKYPAL